MFAFLLRINGHTSLGKLTEHRGMCAWSLAHMAQPRDVCIHLLDARTFLSITQQMLFTQHLGSLPWLAGSNGGSEGVRRQGFVSRGPLVRAGSDLTLRYQSGFPPPGGQKAALSWIQRPLPDHDYCPPCFSTFGWPRKCQNRSQTYS